MNNLTYQLTLTRTIYCVIVLIGAITLFISNALWRGVTKSVFPSNLRSAVSPTTVKTFCLGYVIWGNQEQKEFDTLNQTLCSDKVLLHHPIWNSDFIVQTDASSKGLGAVLSQIGPDNEEHPVRYASRALQPPESKLTTREQELLAVIWTLFLDVPLVLVPPQLNLQAHLTSTI